MKLAQDYRDKPVRVLLVNLREAPDRISSYLEGLGSSPTVLLDREGTVSRLYQVVSLPTAAIIDKHGRIILTSRGELDWGGTEVRRLMDGLAAQ